MYIYKGPDLRRVGQAPPRQLRADLLVLGATQEGYETTGHRLFWREVYMFQLYALSSCVLYLRTSEVRRVCLFVCLFVCCFELFSDSSNRGMSKQYPLTVFLESPRSEERGWYRDTVGATRKWQDAGGNV